MLSKLLFSFYKQTAVIKRKKIFYLVFTEIKMYGPKQGLGPNVKFFWIHFLYVMILIKI